MNIPANLMYSKTDEWFDPETGALGITDYAQGQLSDIVYYEARTAVGEAIKVGDEIASVDSVKANSLIYSPVAGKVTAVNEDLPSNYEVINKDPYGAGWMVKVEGGDAGGLMDASAYEKYCAERAE